MAPNPWFLLAGWLICQVGSNAGQSALTAVMSDIIPEEQHGVMSALLGTSPTAAMVTGVFLTQYTIGNSLAMFLVPWLLAPIAVTLFVAVVPDPSARKKELQQTASSPPPPRGRNPLLHLDFTWAFGSRFLVLFAYAFALTYQVYFMTDRLHIAQAEVTRLMTLTTSITGVLSVAVSFLGGWLSDRFMRRKPFVIIAAVVMAVGLLGVALANDYQDMLWAMALISIGQGLYYSVDVALCVEVLPDRNHAARDLGIMNIASSLPQSAAPAVAPFLLAIGMGLTGSANYELLFMVGAGIALIGALAIMPIRGVR